MHSKIFLFSCFMALTLTGFCQDSTLKQNAISDEDQIFTKVEQESSFPGGLHAFRKFLETNLNASTPVDHNAKSGHYTVIVKFIVSKTGMITDVTPETNCGYGMEAEVVRVIKLSPAWIPAMQNGKAVNAYHRQPVTFVVSK